MGFTIAAFVLIWEAGLPAQPPPPTIVPSFQLDTLDGEVVRVHQGVNRPVVINFWATWCIPCQYEMPLLEKAYRDYHDQNLWVIGINTGAEPNIEAVQAWVEVYQLTFPIGIDASQKIQTLYNVRGVPTTYFIDRYGRIQKVIVGAFEEKALNEGLTAIGVRN